MDASDLKSVRLSAGLSQTAAAERLEITQAYLSLIERGLRPLTSAVEHSVANHLNVPAIALPFRAKPPASFEHSLAAIGYPAFAHLKSRVRYNPAELLLFALDNDDLPGRVLEALPWLLLAFPKMNWQWLLNETKLRDRQNRLGYILHLALELAEKQHEVEMPSLFKKRLHQLERSRLAGEDTLCYQSMTPSERQWQRQNRPAHAVHWNLLTHLQVEHLSHV